MKPEEIGTTSTCTRSKVDLTAQYCTKLLRIRTIIVQLITIELISDRLHGNNDKTCQHNNVYVLS